MYVFGSKRSASRPSWFSRASASSSAAVPSSSASSSTSASAASSARVHSRPSPEASAIPPRVRQFDLTLLVACLPAAGRQDYLQRLQPLVENRPAWAEEAIAEEAAEQCRAWWWPLHDAFLTQHTPTSLQALMLTELESGLRSAATPFWLLNHIVRHVWLLHQGRRVGQVYRELERQLGDAQVALAWVSQVFARL